MFSFVTIGFKSVPFLLFLLPLPLAAAEATLAICFPLLITAFLISPPFIIPRASRGCVGGWCGGGWEKQVPLDDLFDLSDLDPFAIPVY